MLRHPADVPMMDTMSTLHLSPDDLDTLIESLEYSRLAIVGDKNASPAVRADNLKRVEIVAAKLRAVRKSGLT